VLVPEDGLLLGNGDLSVSIYQKPNQIVWRLGKGDVWDRRHDTTADPSPVTMDELRRGLDAEGWRCPPYGGPVEAIRGTANPGRMNEVLQPPQSQARPYPMPKPVGELSLHWPSDLQQPRFVQQLFIEEARMEITCQWPDGERLRVECFVPPAPNVLVVRWWLDGFDPGAPQPFFKKSPVWLSLYRWADPPIAEFASSWKARFQHPGFDTSVSPSAQPLPPPQVVHQGGYPVIKQRFFPDPLFPDGFEYWLGAITNKQHVVPVDTGPLREARLHIADLPPMSHDDLCDVGIKESEPSHDHGWIVVPVTTSLDTDAPVASFQKIRMMLANHPEGVLNQWQDANLCAARDFWSRSSVRIAGPVMEPLWYETLHVCRSVFRSGTIPPGLFLPSTINDYSLWHGDYHTNYNLQQPFWGVHTANHPELAEAYFTAMLYLNQIGQKIARDFCGTRGTFIQISGYPIEAQEDPYPTAPMGRMPYMTGWAAEIFWWHYLYTQDTKYLRERAYPFIRDCALFYTDFLRRGDDGLYHAFPSCWGEEGYDGNPETSTDAQQTIEYAAFCLRMALRAAEALDVDGDLQAAWRERIAKLATGRGDSEYRPLPQANEARHVEFNPPDFRPALFYRYSSDWPPTRRFWGWTDKLIRQLMRDVRGGLFCPDHDFADLVKVLQRWRHPNGLVWPMPVRFYGHAGAWTESLGIIAPLQEMMLQSWDGQIRIFPAWPRGVDAEFRDWLTEGGFEVSAEILDGIVRNIRIVSRAGRRCVLQNPWSSQRVRIAEVPNQRAVLESGDGTLAFDTQAGRTYAVEASKGEP
jgi:hypothetical protein